LYISFAQYDVLNKGSCPEWNSQKLKPKLRYVAPHRSGTPFFVTDGVLGASTLLIQGKKGKYAAMGDDDSLFLCLNFHRYLKEKKFLIQRKK